MGEVSYHVESRYTTQSRVAKLKSVSKLEFAELMLWADIPATRGLTYDEASRFARGFADRDLGHREYRVVKDPP